MKSAPYSSSWGCAARPATAIFLFTAGAWIIFDSGNFSRGQLFLLSGSFLLMSDRNKLEAANSPPPSYDRITKNPYAGVEEGNHEARALRGFVIFLILLAGVVWLATRFPVNHPPLPTQVGSPEIKPAGSTGSALNRFLGHPVTVSLLWVFFCGFAAATWRKSYQAMKARKNTQPPGKTFTAETQTPMK